MFKLSLLTPEKKIVVDQEISVISVPARSGERQILPGHVAMVASLGTGILKYKLAGSDVEHKYVISWGYCEINSEGVNVLAEFVQSKEEIDVDAAKLNMTTYKAKMVHEMLTDDEYEDAIANIQKAESSLVLAN